MHFSKAIFIGILCTFFASTAFAGVGIIQADDVIMRTQPTVDGEKLDKLHKNDKVEILGSSGNWFQISFQSKKGYVRDDFIVKVKEDGSKKSTASQKAVTYYVVGDNVSVRNDATTQSQKVAVKNSGDKIEVLAKKGDWLVTTVGGKKGYVRSDLVSQNKPEVQEDDSADEFDDAIILSDDQLESQLDTGVVSPALVFEQPQVYTTPVDGVMTVGHTGQAVVVLQEALAYLEYFGGSADGNYGTDTAEAVFAFQNAQQLPGNGIADPLTQQTLYGLYNQIQAIITYSMQFQGVPYAKGGRSPQTGFDCSGFTRYVFMQFDIKLGASSSDQNQNGLSIPFGQQRPGDLLTFGPSIHHVGLYIGDGEYIHATKPGDVVRIGRIKDEKKDTIYVRRVVGQ